MKNTGFIAPIIKPEDYVLGSSPLGQIVLCPDGNWLPYLGDFEPQQKQIETFNCTSFNTLGCIEAIETRLDSFKENYSDRYTGLMAGTRPPGNNPLKVADYLRKSGAIPESMLPFSDDLKTAEEYYSFKNGDESACALKGQQWVETWEFGYEIVPTNPEMMKKALQFSPLGVSVYAWNKNKDLYTAEAAWGVTHWTKLVGYRDGEYWIVEDSYLQDGTPIKHLAWNFPFGLAVRYHLALKDTAKKKLTFWQNLLRDAKRFLETWFPPLATAISLDVINKMDPIKEHSIEKYKWGTKAEVRHSIRVICDEEGLSWANKNIICATIQAESGFNTKAVNKNNDKRQSTDYGLCQYNSYWYIGPGKPIASVEEALNDPERCVRVMISQFKKGRLKDWVAFSSGLYKKYL